MTRKQIDQAREIRLWVGQIVIPMVGVAMCFPEVRSKTKDAIISAKDKIKNTFTKK